MPVWDSLSDFKDSVSGMFQFYWFLNCQHTTRLKYQTKHFGPRSCQEKQGPDIFSLGQADKTILAQGDQIEPYEKYLGQISLKVFAYF